MPDSHDLAEVKIFMHELTSSEALREFLVSTRGRFFYFSELPNIDVHVPSALSHNFDNLGFYVLTDQTDKGFAEDYKVLELGVGISNNLLVFKNNNSDFRFGSHSNGARSGLDLSSPSVRCGESKR